MRFIDLVNERRQYLNASDWLMCQKIHGNPENVPNMSTSEFAKLCMSSKSSVIRFSQKLGFTGFSELRNFLKWQVSPASLPKDVPFKEHVLQDVRRLLDFLENSDWSPIYEILEPAERCYVLSTGVTQRNQAQELQRLFLLLGKPLSNIPGSVQTNELRRSLEQLREGDVVFVLSLSGENTQLEDLVTSLRTTAAKIISITSLQNNWLAEKADFNLYAMTSRSPLPRDWWLQTASSFFVLIEAFLFGYVDWQRAKNGARRKERKKRGET